MGTSTLNTLEHKYCYAKNNNQKAMIYNPRVVSKQLQGKKYGWKVAKPRKIAQIPMTNVYTYKRMCALKCGM